MRGAEPAAGHRRPPRPPPAEVPDRLLNLTGWPGGFDPEHLGPWASLNKLAVGPVAGSVVEEMGDRLGSLVATLRAPATAAAATGVRRSYLEVWQQLATVVIGGGLVREGVGERVAGRAADAAGADVRAAPHPEWLSLTGAARSNRFPLSP